MELRDNIEEIRAAGLQIVGISYDDVATLKAFSDEENIPFLLLSDEGSETIKAYGIHHKEGLPHPGTLLVDRDGVIRGKLFFEGYKLRHSVDSLLEAARRIGDEVPADDAPPAAAP